MFFEYLWVARLTATIKEGVVIEQREQREKQSSIADSLSVPISSDFALVYALKTLL